MDPFLLTEIGDAERLAVEYCTKEFRPPLSAFFAFDARLAQIASKTREPALGQMRLAWWRDVLSQPVNERPKGDIVLEALSEHWAGSEARLIEVVDAWEILIASEKLTKEEVVDFACGRVMPLVRIVQEGSENTPQNVVGTLELWALADVVPKITDDNERSIILEAARANRGQSGLFPRAFRGIAVLHALARRSVARGGQPMLEGRGAALIALRVGLIGR